MRTFLYGLMALMAAGLSAARSETLSDAMRETLEQRFSGARIREVEQETWRNQRVTEVDVESADGTCYELIFSEAGELLYVEEDREGLPWIGGELSIGLAARAEREIYKGVGTELEPTPFFLYENGPLEILSYDDFGVLLKLYRGDMFSVGAGGTLKFGEGYDPGDSPDLEGMDGLHTLYSVDIEFELERGPWEIGLEVSQDVSGENDGQEIELVIGYEMAVAGFSLRPELSLTWLSADTVDYFYGVAPHEAREGRPVYKPGSDFELEAGLRVLRPIGGGFTLVGLAGVSTFGREIRDSPLVDADVALEGTLGVMYTF